MRPSAGDREWLETNHRGSFAMGSVDRRLRRKYHALLNVRDASCGTEPWSVLAELGEHVAHDGTVHTLADPLYGAAAAGVETLGFEAMPQPTHRYRFDGVTVERRVRLAVDRDQVEITYRVEGLRGPAELALEPFVRARPIHALMVENPVLDGSFSETQSGFVMVPYPGMPAIAWSVVGASARFESQGRFCSDVRYPREAERGYADREDVFCPGTLRVALEEDGAITLLVGLHATHPTDTQKVEPSPAGFGPTLQRACGQFVVRGTRDERSLRDEIIAGFPWFGSRPRDTLIALPGLHLALGDQGVFAQRVLEGLLEQRVLGLIPEATEPDARPSLDATLLFIRAVQWLSANQAAAIAEPFMKPVTELLEALAEGSDERFRLLPGAGVEVAFGAPVTWMNAVADGAAVTPRYGHVVEIDALAYHDLCFALAWAEKHDALSARRLKKLVEGSEQRFLERFWSEARGYLADSDRGHGVDGRLQPNQLWATALTCSPLTPAMKASVFNHVRERLWVPAGLRTLDPRDLNYHGQHRGNAYERDRASHQGNAWPWLLGIYADTILNVHGRAALESELAATLSYFAKHVREEGCIGQVNEVFDGDAPNAPGGAPAAAWSACELYRVWRLLHVGM